MSICHKALKKGVSSAEKQNSIIEDILFNSPKTLEFAKHFFDTNDYEKIVDLIYMNLK